MKNENTEKTDKISDLRSKKFDKNRHFNKVPVRQNEFDFKKFNIDFTLEELEKMQWFILNVKHDKESSFVKRCIEKVYENRMCIFVPSNKSLTNIKNINEMQGFNIKHLSGCVFLGVKSEGLDDTQLLNTPLISDIITKNSFIVRLLSDKSTTWNKIINMFHSVKENKFEYENVKNIQVNTFVQIIRGPFRFTTARVVSMDDQLNFPLEVEIEIIDIVKKVRVKYDEVMAI